MEELRLVKPSEEYLEQIKAYREEFRNCLSWMHGTGGLMNYEAPKEWLEYRKAEADRETVYMYIRMKEQKIVGMINIRHTHTEPLSTFGGHVGYSVCPSERRKGYATQMLHEVLPYCKEIGLDKVLLTCGEENTGSRKTILANGGVFEATVMSPKHHVIVERYWITI